MGIRFLIELEDKDVKWKGIRTYLFRWLYLNSLLPFQIKNSSKKNPKNQL